MRSQVVHHPAEEPRQLTPVRRRKRGNRRNQ
ncbi:MAG: hypothetical protein JWM85_253, partial [Acidimicrobiaceae bacterium]|nr:hypothetical protein [Acidimicrobiaceae bacterium]